MKSREPPQGGAAYAEGRKTKNRHRLGGRGVGLSLMSFANAKSKETGYNPAIIKKQREFYKNAKIVKKFKKTVKRHHAQGEKHVAGGLPDENAQHGDASGKNEIAPGDRKERRRKKKKDVRLQSVREEYEKKREEKERERREREAAIQAKKEARAKAEAGRKALRERMFKRTSSGQPIMRYRIEHLLQGILQSPPS